jgi:hypothetical protein
MTKPLQPCGTGAAWRRHWNRPGVRRPTGRGSNRAGLCIRCPSTRFRQGVARQRCPGGQRRFGRAANARLDAAARKGHPRTREECLLARNGRCVIGRHDWRTVETPEGDKYAECTRCGKHDWRRLAPHVEPDRRMSATLAYVGTTSLFEAAGFRRVEPTSGRSAVPPGA